MAYSFPKNLSVMVRNEGETENEFLDAQEDFENLEVEDGNVVATYVLVRVEKAEVTTRMTPAKHSVKTKAKK